jgi:hypothetical protein
MVVALLSFLIPLALLAYFAPLAPRFTPWLMGFLMFSALLGSVLVPAYALRHFLCWDRSQNGLLWGRHGLFAHRVLNASQEALAEALPPHEDIEGLWVSGGLTLGSSLDWLLVWAGFLAFQTGAILDAVLTTAEGSLGGLVASFLYLVPWGLLAMTTRPSRSAPCLHLPALFFLFPMPLAGIYVGYVVSPESPPPLPFHEGFLILFLILLLWSCYRIFWLLRNQGHPSILAKTSSGFHLVTLSMFQGGILLPHWILRPLNRWLGAKPILKSLCMDHPLRTTKEDDGLLLDLPLGKAKHVAFNLHLDHEIQSFQKLAPPLWHSSLSSPEPSRIPLIPRKILLLHGTAAFLISFLVMYVFDLQMGLLPHLKTWEEGNPLPLLEASRRMDCFYPILTIPCAYRALTAQELGYMKETQQALKKNLFLSGIPGISQKLAKSIRDAPGFQALMAGKLELDRKTAELPRGEKELAQAKEYEQLVLQFPPPSRFPVLGPLRLAREAFRATAGESSEARLLLAEFLGQIRWPLDLLVGTNLPKGVARPWAREALDLLEKDCGIEESVRLQIRGRILFRQENYPAAIQALSKSSNPMDQMLCASAMRTQPGHLREAWRNVMKLRKLPTFKEMDGDFLIALMLVQRKLLPKARRLLRHVSKEEPGRFFRAKALLALLKGLEEGPPPRQFTFLRDLKQKETEKKPKQDEQKTASIHLPFPTTDVEKNASRKTNRTYAWKPWILREDMVLLYGILADKWSHLPSESPSRDPHAIEKIATNRHSVYSQYPLAEELRSRQQADKNVLPILVSARDLKPGDPLTKAKIKIINLPIFESTDPRLQHCTSELGGLAGMRVIKRIPKGWPILLTNIRNPQD